MLACVHPASSGLALAAAVLCNWIGMGTLDGIGKEVITQFAHVTALVKKLNEHEKIKAWNTKNNPKLPWL